MLIRKSVQVVFAYVYFFSLYFCYLNYLNPTWDYFGFQYVPPASFEIIIVLVFMMIGTIGMPTNINSPSALIITFSYHLVYIPALLSCLLVKQHGAIVYFDIIVSLSFIFLLCGLAISAAKGASLINYKERVDGKYEKIDKFAFLLWIILGAILIFNYSSIMSFSSLEDVYSQRAVGASSNALLGYSQTYFGYVFSPYLLVLGITKRSVIAFIAGFSGFFIMYAINAERTLFLMPFLVIALSLAINSRMKILIRFYFISMILSSVVFIVTIFHKVGGVFEILATYIVFRTIGLPGLSIPLYQDLFSKIGYTYWSHINGMSLISSVPDFFNDEQAWPRLGVLIGKYLYNNSENNYNANLFSSDGIASAGSVGLIIMGLFFSAFLFLLEKLSKSNDNRFSILSIVPLAMVLVNGSLFTALLSFGGFFWILAFYLRRA